MQQRFLLAVLDRPRSPRAPTKQRFELVESAEFEDHLSRELERHPQIEEGRESTQGGIVGVGNVREPQECFDGREGACEQDARERDERLSAGGRILPMKQVRSRPGPGSPGKHDALMCRIDEPVDIDGGCYYSHGIIALLEARQQGKRSRDERCG